MMSPPKIFPECFGNQSKANKLRFYFLIFIVLHPALDVRYG